MGNDRKTELYASMMPPTWAVAICEPGRDFEADRNLRRYGWRTVCLSYRHRLTGHNRPGWRVASDFISRPLLSPYLFLQLWPDQEWPKRELVAGYFDLVRHGPKPIAVPEIVVRDWWQRVNAGEFDDRPPLVKDASRPKYQPANDPAERRRILEQAFAALVEPQDAVAEG